MGMETQNQELPTGSSVPVRVVGIQALPHPSCIALGTNDCQSKSRPALWTHLEVRYESVKQSAKLYRLILDCGKANSPSGARARFEGIGNACSSGFSSLVPIQQCSEKTICRQQTGCQLCSQAATVVCWHLRLSPFGLPDRGPRPMMDMKQSNRFLVR